MVKILSGFHPHEEKAIDAQARMKFLSLGAEIPEDLLSHVDVVPGRDLRDAVSDRVVAMLSLFAPSDGDYSDDAVVRQRAILDLVPSGMEIPEKFLGFMDVTPRPDLSQKIEKQKAFILSSVSTSINRVLSLLRPRHGVILFFRAWGDDRYSQP